MWRWVCIAGLLGIILIAPSALGLPVVRSTAPTATPSPTPGGPSVTAGGYALLGNLEGNPLALLSAPESSAAIILDIPSGARVFVTNGPNRIKGLSWWRVRVYENEGWILTSLKIGKTLVQTLAPFSDAQLQQAVADFNHAIDNKPDTAAYIGRGLAYYDQGNYDDAIASFDFALQLSPDDTLITFYHGMAYYGRKMYDQAIADFTRAIMIHPDNAMLNHARCLVDLALKNYRVAIGDCSRAIEINPNYATALTNRGLAYQALGQQAPALDDFTQAIKLDSFYATAYRHRAAIYREQDDNEAAIADLTRAVELDPNDAESYKALGDSYFSLQKYEDARKNYQHYLDLVQTSDPEVEARLNEIARLALITATPGG